MLFKFLEFLFPPPKIEWIKGNWKFRYQCLDCNWESFKNFKPCPKCGELNKINFIARKDHKIKWEEFGHLTLPIIIETKIIRKSDEAA